MAPRLPVSRLRSACVLIVLSSILAACQSQSDFLRVGSLIYGKMSGLWSSDAITRSQVLAVPYATLGVRLGGSGEAMLVLESTSGATLRWVGGTQFAISTRNGRIERTAGFAHNLTGFEESQPQPGSAEASDFRYDFADLNAYGVAVHCVQSVVGEERIVIIGDAHDTVHTAEDCSAPDIDWNFRNEFWKDKSGPAVWRSVQYIHPKLDPITLQALRPAA